MIAVSYDAVESPSGKLARGWGMFPPISKRGLLLYTRAVICIIHHLCEFEFVNTCFWPILFYCFVTFYIA